MPSYTHAHVVFTLPHHLAPLALQNQRGDLRTAVSLQRTDSHQKLPQTPSASAPRDRLLQRSAYVESEAAASSPYSLRRRCRRSRPAIIPIAVCALEVSASFFRKGFSGEVFRGKFLEALQRPLSRFRTARFHGLLRGLAQPKLFRSFDPSALRAAMGRLLQASFRRPRAGAAVISALYTHRVAISNLRLVSFQDDKVTFRWRDSAHKNKETTPHFACR